MTPKDTEQHFCSTECEHTWHDHHGDGPLTEESVWQAIADANGLDYEDIADGDITEWL